MKRILSIVLYVIVIAPCMGLITMTFLKEAVDAFSFSQQKHLYLVLSFVVSYVLFLLLRNKTSLVRTLKHEVVHWLFASLFLYKTKGLNINEKGGWIEIIPTSKSKYSLKGVLIILSPYFFPISFLACSLLSLIGIKDASIGFQVLVGVALGFDFFSIQNDIHLGQTDFKEYSLLVNITVIITGIVFYLAVILSFIQNFSYFNIYEVLVNTSFSVYQVIM